VDSSGTNLPSSGTSVDEAVEIVRAVQDGHDAPLFVLTPSRALTCDDAARPQFPQALLRRRILLLKRPVLIEAEDKSRSGHPDEHTDKNRKPHHRMEGRP